MKKDVVEAVSELSKEELDAFAREGAALGAELFRAMMTQLQIMGVHAFELATLSADDPRVIDAAQHVYATQLAAQLHEKNEGARARQLLPLNVDAERLKRAELAPTGIYVRAKHDGIWGAYDVIHLDRESLITWLRSGNDLAEKVLVLFFGHTPEGK